MSTSRDLWTRLGGNSISFDIPGKQFFDAVDGMLRDPRQDLSEIELRVQRVELCAAHERIDGCGSHAARIGACEQVVASSESDSAQGALGAGVIDLDQPIIYIAREGTPARERIADGPRSVGFGRECFEFLFEPSMKLIKKRLGSGLPDLSSCSAVWPRISRSMP